MEETKRESLDQMFAQLEEVTGKMEGEEISLEESFELYSKGMNLLKQCSQAIDEVEKKVLVLDENGETHEF
ncbi:MAG TPA: exodeoxyribonuclease VII small subunit [Candidatus Mediterraneibacter avicola]|nr:exodeoxyribonuclease VII small subunit [Candidatus Mediterraneibacter avicola]